MPKKSKPEALTETERVAVAGLIREHLRTTRNILSPTIEPLKSVFAKLAPSDDPPPTPRIRHSPIGLVPSRKR